MSVHIETLRREREERGGERKMQREREAVCVYVAALFDHIKFINPPLARRKARRGGGVQKVTACRLWQPLQRVYFPDVGRVSVYEGRGGEEAMPCR